MKLDYDASSCSTGAALGFIDPHSWSGLFPHAGYCICVLLLCVCFLRGLLSHATVERGGAATPPVPLASPLHTSTLPHLALTICTSNVLTPSRGVWWVRFLDKVLEILGCSGLLWQVSALPCPPTAIVFVCWGHQTQKPSPESQPLLTVFFWVSSQVPCWGLGSSRRSWVTASLACNHLGF